MRVLFVVKEYLPKPTPPGLCIMNVQKALADEGVESDVLMVGDKEGKYCSNEYGDVYSIKSDISFEKTKERKIHYYISRLPMVFTWPVPSLKRVNDYRRMITKLNEDRKYEAIIGTMFPPDVCVACSSFNHFFYYELDSLINNPMYKQGLKKYLKHRLYRLEKRLFDSAELIIRLNHNRMFYSKEKYKIYEQKTIYTDIPELTETMRMPSVSICTADGEKESVLMVYSGHLSKEYRSPTRLIQVIKALSMKMKVLCLFFSRGDCEDELRQAEEETNGVIRRMGYVSQKELSGYISRADFLLDIGNKLSGEDYSLPSKVICYMATGMPIIHMNGRNDSAIPYLEKYGLAINVENDIPLAGAVDEIKAFVDRNRGKRLLFNEVEAMFPKNTPAYTAKQIVNKICSLEIEE